MSKLDTAITLIEKIKDEVDERIKDIPDDAIRVTQLEYRRNAFQDAIDILESLSEDDV